MDFSAKSVFVASMIFISLAEVEGWILGKGDGVKKRGLLSTCRGLAVYMTYAVFIIISVKQLASYGSWGRNSLKHSEGVVLVREERFMNIASFLQYVLKESGPLTILGTASHRCPTFPP